MTLRVHRFTNGEAGKHSPGVARDVNFFTVEGDLDPLRKAKEYRQWQFSGERDIFALLHRPIE